MSNASDSHRIIYYNKKTLRPIPIYPNEEDWIQSLDEELQWKYVDVDDQKKVTIQIASDASFKKILTIKEFIQSRKRVNFSKVGINQKGIYYWRIKAMGTQASVYSDYSRSRVLKVDNINPTIDSIDIVSINNTTEFHSNMKPAIGNIGFDDGIFISADEFNQFINIDISYPFNEDLSDGNIQKRSTKRTYFIDVYFPNLTSTKNLDVYAHPDIYFEKDVFDVDESVETGGRIDLYKLNFPKLSASLYVHDKNENSSISQREFPIDEKWSMTFPHHGIVILKIFYFEEDFIYNSYSKYLVEQKENVESFHRKYTWDTITLESTKNTSYVYKSPLIANKLIKIGRNLTPPSTYVVNDPILTTGLPKFCFGLGMNSIKKLEMLDNSYYPVNSLIKNSVSTLGSINSTTLATDVFTHLKSSVFDNIRNGDVVTFLNSYFSYLNFPSAAVNDLGTYRNFRNSFEIKDTDSSDNGKITLYGLDEYVKYISKRYPGPSDSYSGTISYDSTLDVTTISSEDVLLSSLQNPGLAFSLNGTLGISFGVSTISTVSESSKNKFGNHSLSNYFIGINGDDNVFREYAIIDNNAGSITISGNILSNLNRSEGDSVNFYISGDVFTVYNNSLFVGTNNVRIYAKSSSNVSGIGGIKVIETIPTTNKKIVDTIPAPSNIYYSLTKHSEGNLSGPLTIKYNISSLDEDGNEGIVSDDITIRIEDDSSYFVTLAWNNVIDNSKTDFDYAQSYRIYGRSNKEEERTLLAQVPFNHKIGSTFSLNHEYNVSWNDFGSITLPTTADASLDAPTSFTATLSNSGGFLSDETDYYYQVIAFEFDNNFNILEGTASSEISKTTNDVGNISKISFTWNSVTGADGYRIYGRVTGSSKTLISTIFGNITSYTDSGTGYLLSNKLISGNVSYTRTSLPGSDSDIDYKVAISSVSTDDLLETGEDVAYIDYTISDTTNEVVDFYFRIISNAELESTYALDNLATASISRKLSQTKTEYDVIKPSGTLKLFNNGLGISDDSMVTIDYTEYKKENDPLSTVKFSNFSNDFYTNQENAITGYKSWKVGFDVNLKVPELGTTYWKATTDEEIGNYGQTIDGSSVFFWAKVPVVSNDELLETPLSTTDISPYISDMIGKKGYVVSKAEDSEKLTCLNIEYDAQNNRYVMLVKLRTLDGIEPGEYLSSTMASGSPIIISTSEFNTADVESFTGLHAYLENESGLPYRIISYPNIDFKESLASEFDKASVGELDRLQYDISAILQEDSRYVKSYWSGNIYASVTGDYLFNIGIRGDVSLFVGENVDKYYKYLNISESKKTYKLVNDTKANIGYRIWTVDLGEVLIDQETEEESVISTKKDTYVEHVYKQDNSGSSLVNGGYVRLNRGWQKIKIVLTYDRNESELQTNSNAMSLQYNVLVNEKFTTDFPIIDSVNEDDYSIDISFDNEFIFEDNSLIGSVALFGILDPTNGSAVSGVGTTSTTELQNDLLDGGAVSDSGAVKRHLILDSDDIDDDFVISYSDRFDFIQPDIRVLTFSPIKDIKNIENAGTKTTGIGKIKTVQWSTTVTTIGSTGAFANVSVGDSIIANSETRYVVSKASSNSITINKYANWENSENGYSWEYVPSADKILILPENDIPIFRFGGQQSSKYRIFKYPIIIKGNTGNNIEFNSPITGEIQGISTDTDNQITTITSEGIGISNFQLDFYGYPIVLDVDGDNEILRQALIIDENTIQVNGILPSYSEDEDDIDEDTDLYPHETKYLSTEDNPVTFRLGDINDIISSNSICYINLGKTISTFNTDHLSKNCLPVYAKIRDRYNNETKTKVNVSLRGTFDTQPDGGSSVYDNSVLELYVSGDNKGKVRTTTVVGEQAFDANLIETSVGIYESEIYTVGTNFSFWKTISWDTNTLQSYSDVKFEIRTGETEEDCKNATWNLDSLGIQNDPYTILSYDYPSTSTSTAVNISDYTSDGTVDSNNEIVKKRFIQFRITLSTSDKTYTPKVDNVTITYNTSRKNFLRSKNIELGSNLIRGIVTGNTSLPTGTSLEFGINTFDKTDFSEYYRIYLDEAFTLPEDLQNDQFRLGIVFTSSNDDVPKLYSLSFMFECESGQELINLNL